MGNKPTGLDQRVLSIDGGEPRPVTGASMDAAIAGLAEGVGRVEVAPANRVRITPREARALDLQLNGFATHSLLHGHAATNAEDAALQFAAGLSPLASD